MSRRCITCGQEDPAYTAWKADYDRRRIDNPRHHKNILERLQWIFRKQIEGRDWGDSVQLAYHEPEPVSSRTMTASPEPVKYETYRFFRDTARYPTHRVIRWSCLGLTVSEEIEFYDLPDVGH